MKDKYWYSIYALPYIYFIGAIHLLLYWRSFGVNPFEHASFFDAIGAAISPVSIMIFMGLVVNFIIIATHRAWSGILPSGPLLFKVILPVFMVLYPVILFSFAKPFIAWGSMGLLGFAFSFLLCLNRLFFSKCTDFSSRLVLALIFVAIPIASICSALAESSVISDKGPTHWVANVQGSHLTYVGTLGGKYFFTDDSRARLTIVTEDSMAHLTLIRPAVEADTISIRSMLNDRGNDIF